MPAIPPLIILTLLLSFSSLSTSDLSADRSSLLALRSSIGPYLPWNLSTSPCSWQGITCESNRVTVIRLPASNLIGKIPPSIFSNLSSLHTLSLRYNALTGPFPDSFPSQLRNLYLHRNKFSGPLPGPSLANLTNLVRLNLAGNRFSGKIPDEINLLTRLGTLYLEDNDFEGEIPDMKNLDSLRQFNVSGNEKLNGSIPQKVRSMQRDSFLSTGLCGSPLAKCPWEVDPSSPSKGKKGLSGGAIAGIAIAAVVAFLILLCLIFLLCRKKGSKKSSTRSADVAVASVEKAPDMEIPLTDKRVVGDGAPVPVVVPPVAPVTENGAKKLIFFGSGEKVYDLEDLLRASAEVLGKGTFGTAYKAVLEMGVTVAVKRLKEVNITDREFRERINVIGNMEHANLVGLRAYYFSKEERLLVYDYMSMGSLSSLLHGNRGSGRTPLNWETRSAIALAAAKGIEYIHSTSPTASHGNIKSSNVLLDRSYEAKVSDHGLNTLAGPSPTPNRVAGYKAPEVTDARKVSQKADIFSFGVLLLELLTGKAPAQAALNEEGVDLPRWVQSVVQEEWTSEVFDLELLRYQSVEEEMVELLQLAIDCAAQYPDRRPTMSEVVKRIEEIRQSSLLPPSDDKEEGH